MAGACLKATGSRRSQGRPELGYPRPASAIRSDRQPRRFRRSARSGLRRRSVGAVALRDRPLASRRALDPPIGAAMSLTVGAAQAGQSCCSGLGGLCRTASPPAQPREPGPALAQTGQQRRLARDAIAWTAGGHHDAGRGRDQPQPADPITPRRYPALRAPALAPNPGICVLSEGARQIPGRGTGPCRGGDRGAFAGDGPGHRGAC
jgi:hypothetical protein